MLATAVRDKRPVSGTRAKGANGWSIVVSSRRSHLWPGSIPHRGNAPRDAARGKPQHLHPMGPSSCPTSPPRDLALVTRSWGRLYHEPRGVQRNPVLQPSPHLPSSPRHSLCFPDRSTALPKTRSLHFLLQRPGWIIPQASSLQLPCPLHPPRKECGFAKARQEQSSKEQFCNIFFSGPF